MASQIIDELLSARRAEKEQAIFYRALAVEAEDIRDAVTAERLNGLHADEQHHYARLSVRLMELGEEPPDLPIRSASTTAAHLATWESDAREHEKAEIARYERLLKLEIDDETRDLLSATLSVEHHHFDSLGGKWTPADGNSAED